MYKVVRLFCILAVSLASISCYNLKDILDARITVLADDGKTPMSNLPIAYYDWIINFKDGSSIADRIQDTGIVTDENGQWFTTTTDRDLRSGQLHTHCTDVCVERRYVSDGYWQEYDKCVDWEEDEDGNEYCAAYETDYYWVDTSYDYCSEYAQDCYDYYPRRALADIQDAFAEIGYSDAQGGAWSVQSLTATNNAQGFVDDSHWKQDDTFITNLLAVTSGNGSKKHDGLNNVNPEQKRVYFKQTKRGQLPPKFAKSRVRKGHTTVIPFEKLNTLSTEKMEKVLNMRKKLGVSK